MRSLLTSKKNKHKNCFLALKLSYDIKNHQANNSNVWQNPNDPDDETEHFKQPHIAIDLLILKFKYNYHILHLTE